MKELLRKFLGLCHILFGMAVMLLTLIPSHEAPPSREDIIVEVIVGGLIASIFVIGGVRMMWPRTEKEGNFNVIGTIASTIFGIVVLFVGSLVLLVLYAWLIRPILQA